MPRERSFLVARGTDGPAHSRKARSAFRTTTLDGGRWNRPPTRRPRTFAAPCAANWERDALPVTHAEREPQAPSSSRRRGPTTTRDRRLPARWRGGDAATELGAGAAGNPRGDAARGHHREQRDRSAWVDRRDASFVSAGNRRFPACSQHASRSDDIAGRRPARGQNPPDSGTITREIRSLERQRVPASEATASPRAARAGRRPASRRRACRGRSGFLNPYPNTTRAPVRTI